MAQKLGKRRKPSVSRCPASRYERPGERIVEVTGTDGVGCLMSIRSDGDGHLVMSVYRADPGVSVVVGDGVTVYPGGGPAA